MNAGLEGLIEGAHAVCREEQNALEVLEEAEEDGDKGVAMDVGVLALLTVEESD